ncbi:unnamed protein product [Mytilus edulis]|uniref:EGF-like domain-containing protein n=1 Tax=Mytilus edulis TaxID=6550 RepID=A0A8S3V2Q5_MYTED|nr:unnamed protein product [Mytilus edulis]
MYNYIILRLGLFLILNRNILSDASCSLPTDIKNSAWEYNYTKVSDNSPQSTILRISTTTLQNSIINLSAVGTKIRDWTCINSLALSNTQTLVLFKIDEFIFQSDQPFADGHFKNYRLYLCMKFTKVTPDLYYFYLLSDVSTAVTPNERVFVSEEGNPPANDAPMCSTFCKYTGLPKIRTLRRQGTSDTVPGDAALCEPCDSTCEVDRCDPNPCQNNGSCTDFKENYNCTCTDGWKGENCTIDRCDPNPCQNNGSCVDFKENYTCVCTDGWKGENCTTDINECLNKKRATVCPLHSDCFNTVGSYGCNCKNGYQDKNGDCTDVNECERKPCPEHSNCTNTIGSFMCTCWIGYVNTSMGCQGSCITPKKIIRLSNIWKTTKTKLKLYKSCVQSAQSAIE